VDTKQKIIRTALRIFLEKGYDRASLREITQEAGVSKGGIYHHFGSKEDLFREALAFITAEMDKWSTSQFRSVKSAKDLVAALLGSLKSMSQAFADIVGEGAQHPYSFLEILINAARRHESVRREMEAVYSGTRRAIEDLLVQSQRAGEIRPDIDCEALALEINALMEGILLLSVLDETINLGAVGSRLSENMWKMMAA
jgi:AcrR family transcriptional regulator